MKPSLVVLGIETSCDETAAAVVEFSDSSATIRAESISSQIDLHALYGGVVPELASREHLRNLPIVCEQALSGAGLAMNDISLIGVTSGPGLKGCLLMGVTFAQGLGTSLGLPVNAVNHVEGHMFSHELAGNIVEYPFLSLVVSGGHTELVLVEQLGKYQVIARTMDDAAGEAFDKSAHLLGLPYPGGAALSQLATSVESSRFVLPKVTRETEDFSFSGLKTAVALAIRKSKHILDSEDKARAEMAYAIEQAIVDALAHKVRRAVQILNVPRLVVAGGVSANKTLRAKLKSEVPEVVFSEPKHCTDNAAMVALIAGKRELAGCSSNKLEIMSQWPVENLMNP